jgi:anti-anti-sigma regulatory factor
LEGKDTLASNLIRKLMASVDRSQSPTAVLHCGPLTATVVRVGRNRLLLELAGRLDCDTVEQLDRRLFLPRRVDIDLDLSQLDFIDEAGIEFFLMLARKKGGRAEAVACSPVAERALESRGLERLRPHRYA